jgi:hypothetical protein
VGIGVGGDGQVALANKFTDPRPGHPAQVQERYSPVAQVVRLKSGMPSALQALAIAVRSASAPDSANNRASGSRKRECGKVASMASASTGSNSTHSARRVLVVAARSAQQPRGARARSCSLSARGGFRVEGRPIFPSQSVPRCWRGHFHRRPPPRPAAEALPLKPRVPAQDL